MLTTEQLIIRLVVAALLGSLVGLERERHDWVAGLRTHMMVCVGSALAMIVSAHGFVDVVIPGKVMLDPSRIAAQVISGIGFLGAGTILYLRHEVIRGLTTAAGLWTVACIGLAIGSGLFEAGIIVTALALIILALLKPLEKYWLVHGKKKTFTIIVKKEISLDLLDQTLRQKNLNVSQLVIQQSDHPEENKIIVTLSKGLTKDQWPALMDQLRILEGVKEIQFTTGKNR